MIPNNNKLTLNTDRKYILERKYPRIINVKSGQEEIYEYEGNKTYNYKSQKNAREKIDINKNYRINRKNITNNNYSDDDFFKLNSEDNFSEWEKMNHQRNYSLNRGINTNSTTLIEFKDKNRNKIKNNYIQNQIKYKNSNIKISGFELYYESDKGERIALKNPNNKNKISGNIINFYKNNNNFYNDIDDSTNKTINNSYKIENTKYCYEIKQNTNQNKTIPTIRNINYNDEYSINNLSAINPNKRIDLNKIKINKIKINNTKKNNTNFMRNKINQEKKLMKFRNYHRPSEIKKIILIQSTFKGYLSRLKLVDYINKFTYFKEFFELLNKIIIERRKNVWKFLKKRIKGNNKHKNRNNNKIIKTKKKILMKTNEINKLHKELGDSFNIKNDELKIKLDDIIKENNDLKNQIFDNKNIEEKMKQLLEENKKNQSINEIIMKDNRQLAKKLKTIQDNRNNQLVIQNQLPVDLTQSDDTQMQSASKLKYLYLKCIFFKKVLKNRNSLKIYFNKYKNNIRKLRKKYSIENNNIFINNKKKINIQMAKNLNINFISNNDNYKHFMLFKLFMKKEQKQSNIIPKYFYKFFYLSNYTNKEKEEKEEINLKKKRILKSLINKKEKNNEFILRNALKEWKLRGVIFKMKGYAKELKKKKKLKKKIRDKKARETLNNLKIKTASFQNTHEFSYKIDKTDKKEENEDNKEEKEENKIKEDEKIEFENIFE